MIENHFTPSLSDLDLMMVRAVPPGGNWKDIPLTIPSQRLTQIRESYRRGEGSRSTYYGRMRHDAPAHTISTYFNRPGNGAFIHYSQDRMISQREAARLQSFPDNFVFLGSKAAINKQIGNAVPPLLAYQIAEALGTKGDYIDLFSGAGGLSLGFEWAGWDKIAANDIDKYALATYRHNLGGEAILGDICSDNIFKQLLEAVDRHPRSSARPRFVLGGPPCQGFSTAGNRRSMDDKRNHLFKRYSEFLKQVKPDGFIFENVPGLKNMEGGRILKLVKSALEDAGYSTIVYTLRAEQYAIPQRRTRIMIFGFNSLEKVWRCPQPVTAWGNDSKLLQIPPTVGDAISDLPSLEPGMNGELLTYSSIPSSSYQCLMRGVITPKEYLTLMRNGDFYESR